jgi:hypothetical protein
MYDVDYLNKQVGVEWAVQHRGFNTMPAILTIVSQEAQLSDAPSVCACMPVCARRSPSGAGSSAPVT